MNECRHRRATKAPEFVQCTIGAMGTMPFKRERCDGCQHQSVPGVRGRIAWIARTLTQLRALARHRKRICATRCGGPLLCPECHCILPIKRRVPQARCPRGWWQGEPAVPFVRLKVRCCGRAVKSASP